MAKKELDDAREVDAALRMKNRHIFTTAATIMDAASSDGKKLYLLRGGFTYNTYQFEHNTPEYSFALLIDRTHRNHDLKGVTLLVTDARNKTMEYIVDHERILFLEWRKGLIPKELKSNEEQWVAYETVSDAMKLFAPTETEAAAE